MQAQVGDRLHVRGRIVGQGEHVEQVVEVRGQRPGEPPYLVRYDDGRETLVFPGSDTIVEHSPEPPSG